MYACYDRHLIILVTWCTPDYITDWLSYYSFIIWHVIPTLSWIFFFHNMLTHYMHVHLSFLFYHSLGRLLTTLSLLCSDPDSRTLQDQEYFERVTDLQ